MKSSLRQPLLLAALAALLVAAGVVAALLARPAPGRPADPLAHSPGALSVVGPDVGPLPADEPSLLAGRRLYVTHCAVCHGATGAGDDLYAAQYGQPMPDLRAHMAPGVHTDGQILAYIRDGISGTSMPGFGILLSEAETAQLAAYVRTFAQASPLVGVDPGALATEQARPPTPTPIPDAQEPLPELVFVREGNLWRSDGRSAPRPITELGPNTIAQHPAFSPDGRQIAFAALELPSGDDQTITATLRLAGRDGGEPRTLWQSTEAQISDPTWAPDGSAVYATTTQSQVAADGSYTQQTEVVRIDLADGAAELFLAGAGDLAISPDGQTLAFVQVRANGAAAAIALAPAAGGEPLLLLGEGAFEEVSALRFSPDGGRIIFAARGEPLTDEPPGGLGAWLLALLAPPAAQAHGTPSDLWAIDVGGGKLRRLTALYEDEPIAAFSPEGGEIVLVGLSGIYRMDSDGGQLRRIDPAGGYGGVDWAPQ